jgi:aarF domain-containing kinase
VRLLVRAAVLGVIFAPCASTVWLAALSPAFRRRVWYPLLTACLGRSGACFVKWAQWSATRSDLFPDALCANLATLQADAPAHGRAHTRRLLEAALCCPPGEYFEAFDEAPLASGSIAQVHGATLRGRRVAVKVRHPGVGLKLRLDARLMGFGAAVAGSLPGLRSLRLGETVEQFSASLAQQSRLDREADALDGFRRTFRRWRDVEFPEPIFATPSIIVESFARGILVNGIARDARVRDVREMSADERSRNAFLVNRGEDVYLKMLLEDKRMHADLHPGNLLYDAPRRRINVVDAGMVAILAESECDAIVGLIEALGAADAAAAARCVRAFDASNKRMTPGEIAAFDAAIARLFAERCRGYGTGVDFGDVVRGVLATVREHRVRVGANYATLIINALCLDGMAHDLLPGYSVLDGARPVLSAHRRLASSRGYDRAGSPRAGAFLFRRLCLPICWKLKAAHDWAARRRALA